LVRPIEDYNELHYIYELFIQPGECK
jgi:hypothetical protein